MSLTVLTNCVLIKNKSIAPNEEDSKTKTYYGVSKKYATHKKHSIT